LIAQALPSQVADPWAVVAHGEHEEPHVAVAVLEEHVPLQSWKPLLHALAHVPPEHDAVALPRVGQAVQAAPHAVASVSDLQSAPHAWNFASHEE